MNLNQLNYLVTIAEEQSFTQAAKKLFVSQPSLSLCVKNIEDELGTPLFNRNQTPITLTDAGSIYIDWARTVLMLKQRTENVISDMTENKITILKVGGSYERILSFVSPVMNQFAKLRPHCHIEIIEDQSAKIQGMLENGEIDISIGTMNDNPILFNSIPICEEIPMLAVPKNLCPDEIRKKYPEKLEFGNCPKINLSEFKDMPFITLSPEQTYGHYFRKCCFNEGFTPNIKAECRVLNTLHNLVISGVGAGLITTAFFNRNHDTENVFYFFLNSKPPKRMVYVSHRMDHYLSHDAQTLIELLQESFE